MSYQQPPPEGYPQYPQQPMQGQPPNFGNPAWQQVMHQQYPSQYPPPQPQKKSRKGLWIALGIGLVVVIAFCTIVSVAASNGAKTSTTGSAASVTTTDQTTAPVDSGNTTVKIGETITVDGVNCTATSAKILPAGQYDQPKKGQEFIVVHVKMANNGQSDQSYNPYDFHAKSSAGNVTDYTYTSSYTANNALDSGTMAPGGKVEGDLVFEIPVGDSKAELTWAPSFFNSSSQYAWTLNVK